MIICFSHQKEKLFDSATIDTPRLKEEMIFHSTEVEELPPINLNTATTLLSQGNESVTEFFASEHDHHKRQKGDRSALARWQSNMK